MNTDPEDIFWHKISRALFSHRPTTDEGRFVARVMEELRRLPGPWDLAWPQFLRWAVPVLGMAAASFFLALRAPEFHPLLSTDSLLAQAQTPDEDPLISSLEEPR